MSGSLDAGVDGAGVRTLLPGFETRVEEYERISQMRVGLTELGLQGFEVKGVIVIVGDPPTMITIVVTLQRRVGGGGLLG